MLIAPQIRKQIIQALDEFIIPSLVHQEVLQVLARPPFVSSQVESWVLSRKLLPVKRTGPAQIIWQWNKEHLVASRMPYWGIVYEGVMDERIGLTRETAGGADAPGITGVRLKAPSVLYIPPGIAHVSGEQPYWHGPGEKHFSRTLWIHTMVDEVLLHLSEARDGVFLSSHSLQVNDPLLVQLERVYSDELQYENNAAPQALLLAFMYRLRRLLSNPGIQISNSCWPRALGTITFDKDESERNREVCKQLTEYIHTHLDHSLTLTQLSQKAGLSPNHLNRIFRQTLGTTVMRYVMERRIDAAKQMLARHPASSKRISDVAMLLGFPSAAGFSMVFRKITGCSPKDFRQREQQEPKNWDTW